MTSIENRTDLYQKQKDLGPWGSKIELARFAERYGLAYKHLPESLPYSTNLDPTSLESRVFATTAIVGLFGSLFFSSTQLTGNTISNLSHVNSNFIGIIFFFVGVLSALIYIKRK